MLCCWLDCGEYGDERGRSGPTQLDSSVIWRQKTVTSMTSVIKGGALKGKDVHKALIPGMGYAAAAVKC